LEAYKNVIENTMQKMHSQSQERLKAAN
jgi:hypothetical protein